MEVKIMRSSRFFSNGSRTPTAKMWTKALKKARRQKRDRWL